MPRSSGSSPLVRGQLPVVQLQSVGRRIIPARAGPTHCLSCDGSDSTDHPRSCGANVTPITRYKQPRGSSPLVRGQPADVAPSAGQIRIIPARAGPTSKRRPAPATNSDHPRSCGANLVFCFRLVFCLGSSPLVRGQPRDSSGFADGGRIIPARAGPTLPQAIRSALTQDHPRSCGANRRSRPMA